MLDKTYDATTTATPTFTITNGLVGSQTLVVTGTATFALSDAGVQTATAQTVSLANGTNGGLAANYTLSAGQTATATIAKATLTISSITAQNKVYDATNAATISTYTSNVIGSDQITFSSTPTFASVNVGTGITVTASSITISGADAGNYTLATTSKTITANITQKALTASMVVADKTYDATTTATPTFTITNGLVGSQTLVVTGTATFGSSNAGTQTATAQTVSLSNGTGLASNYSLSAGQTDTATISPKALTASMTVAGKTYDNTTTATPTFTITNGLVGSQTLVVTGTATFALSDAGVQTATAQTVSLANGTNGGLAANYTLSAGQTATATIAKATLTISSITAQNKVYDATNAATISTYTSNVIGSDQITFSSTPTFASVNVGTGITVTASSITISGADAGNYTLATTSKTITANITQKALTASMVVADKTYDATTTATPTFTITNGLVGSQTLVVTGTATFGSSNAGTQTATAQTVSLSNGTGLASNYSLSAGQTDTATISPKALTASMTVAGKTYDNTTTATPTFTITNGLVGSQTLVVTGTATFALSDAGVQTATAQTVSLANGTNGGLAANYTLSAGQTATATIAKATLTISSITAQNKVYDATNAATISTYTSNVIGSDQITFSSTPTFASVNVGTGITVTASSITISGADAGNYTLATTSKTITANITQKALTASMVVADKTYDATTTATPTFTITNGLVGSQTLVVTGTATFGSSNAGTQTATAQTVSLSNGTGLASNYSLSAGQTDTATISPKALTASMTVAGKTYDNTTTATPTFTITNGLVGSQTLVVTGTATFALSDAGVQTATAQTVSLANGTNGGLAANYTLSAGQTATATIAKATLTISSITAQNKVYDATNAATISTYTSNVIGSDQITFSSTPTFASVNVGTGITVTASSITISGADAGNYTLATTSRTTTANITPATVTLSATKVYDGSTSLTGFVTVTGVAGQTLNYTSATSNDANVGTSSKYIKTITLANNSSVLASNYTLPTLNSSNAPVTINQLSSVTWVGASTGSWGTASNWTNGITPTTAVGSLIPNVATVYVGGNTISINIANIAGNIVSNNATLTVSSTSLVLPTLNITGPVKLESGITSTGSQTYNGAVTLNTNIALITTNSDVTFNQTVNSNGTARTLSVSTGNGNVNFNGDVGNVSQLSNITINTNQLTANNITLAGNLNITSAGASEINGVISNGTSAASLTLNGEGSLALFGNNTYTGVTTIANGTLLLVDDGQISNSSQINITSNSGELNISESMSPTGIIINDLKGSGRVNLGDQYLTLKNAQSTYSGVITGLGGLNIDDGNLTLTGKNTYSGSTTIASNAILNLGTNNAISSTNLMINGGALNISDYDAKVGDVIMVSGSINGGTGVLSGTSFILGGNL